MLEKQIIGIDKLYESVKHWILKYLKCFGKSLKYLKCLNTKTKATPFGMALLVY